MYYGTVTGGSSSQGYHCSMDIFPLTAKTIIVKRQNLYVLDKGADEPIMDPRVWEKLQAELLESVDKSKKSPETRSEEEFCKMDTDILKDAKVFNCTYNDKEPPIVWKIYGDTEYITHDEKYSKIKNKSTPNLANVDFEHKTLHENFFEHVWPDMTGSAAIMDDYLQDPRAEFHQTYTQKNIRFHDPNNEEDPDWKMKQCVLALIAAASEIENGMDCWLAGKGPGRKYHPDFGQWVSFDDMCCFISCAAFIWADKKWWYCERRDVDWDAFMPTVEKWNATRVKVCISWLLMLDEAMSGWRPKNSKRGGLPNITYEPRKPVPLGTMYRNSAECHTGIFIYIDPVMGSERQGRKQFAKTASHLPKVQGGSGRLVSSVFHC